MKKLLLLFMAAVALAACSKDDGGGYTGPNTLTIDGVESAATLATQTYSKSWRITLFGSSRYGDFHFVTLNVETEDDAFDVLVVLPLDKTRLADGVYTLSEEGNFDEYKFYTGVLKSGTMTVTQSGGAYNIEIDGTLPDDTPVSIVYHGSLGYITSNGTGGVTVDDGTPVNVELVCQFYYANFHKNGFSNIFVEMFCEDGSVLDLDFLCPAQFNTLQAGTYTFLSDVSQATGYHVTAADSKIYGKKLTDGSVKVTKSGNIYTFDITDLQFGELSVDCNYKGTMVWEDASEINPF